MNENIHSKGHIIGYPEDQKLIFSSGVLVKLIKVKLLGPMICPFEVPKPDPKLGSALLPIGCGRLFQCHTFKAFLLTTIHLAVCQNAHSKSPKIGPVALQNGYISYSLRPLVFPLAGFLASNSLAIFGMSNLTYIF